MCSNKSKLYNCQWQMGKLITAAEYDVRTLSIHYEDYKHTQLIKHIMKIEGYGGRCKFFLANGSDFTTGFCLDDYLSQLPTGHFGRYCKPFIINLGYVTDYTAGKKCSAIQNTIDFTNVNLRCQPRFIIDYDKHGNKQKKD